MNRKGFKMINAIKHSVFRGCFFRLKLAKISYFRDWLNLRYVKKCARYVENGGRICQK